MYLWELEIGEQGHIIYRTSSCNLAMIKTAIQNTQSSYEEHGKYFITHLPLEY